MHDFWAQEDPNQQRAEMVNFTKNMALLGSALTLMGVERWPVSLAAGEEKQGFGRFGKTIRKIAA
jgi:hypothetical protein